MSISFAPNNPHDRQFAVILEPDEWERQDEELLLSDPRIWRKVNPHLGITVQPNYYEEEIARARIDPEKKKEVITKLFNVFQNNRVKNWITADQVRTLQLPTSIDALNADDGWAVFAGLDFSLGDDLHSTTYLAKNLNTGEFFADLDAWISEEALQKSSIRKLLELWIEQGHLHLSPGATLQPELPINRIIELSEHLNFFGFGYDPYKAKTPINTLSAWVYSLGQNPADYVMPVRQNFATYNPAVMELDFMVRSNPALLHFSSSPLWPWEFSNTVLAVSTDGMENHKPLKANPGSDACKIDHVQALCNALIVYDIVDSKIRK